MTSRLGSLLATAVLLCTSGGVAEAAAATQGKQVFDRWCTACHGPGRHMPGTAALAAKYGKEQPAVLEQRKDLSPEIVRYFVRHGVSIMPPFRKTEITDDELEALSTYLTHRPSPTAADPEK